MWLRKGNTVLVHFRRGIVLYQAVLIMMETHQGNLTKICVTEPNPLCGSLITSPGFFCGNALELHQERQYGGVSCLDKDDNRVHLMYHTMVLQNIYHIGDTKSAQELEVFLKMPKERLRLGCGLQCIDPMQPLRPRQCPKRWNSSSLLLV